MPHELNDEGFPDWVVDAFLRTAHERRSAVMTRVPGRATTRLIDGLHDLKGYSIKAKSCDWGPMAGFVCELPPFNKNGAAGIGSNDEKNADHDRRLATLLRLATDTSSLTDSPPYETIRLSDGSVADLGFGARDVWTGPTGSYRRISPTELVGFVHDRGRSVFAEVVLKRAADDLWDVWHGDIWFEAGEHPRWQRYDVRSWEQRRDERIGADDPDQAGGDDQDARLSRSDKVRAALLALRTAVGTGDEPWRGNGSDEPLRRVRGVANLYRVVPGRARSHLDAVTGDYDLFAVWPSRASVRAEDLLRRASERDPLERVTTAGTTRAVFSRDPGKELSLRVERQFDEAEVLVEVIPPGTRLARLEDPDVGNANPLVTLTAASLNSFAEMAHGELRRQMGGPSNRTGPQPNLAFHGDEGGRPGVWLLDLPAAVFFPRPSSMTGWERPQVVRHEDERGVTTEIRTGHLQPPWTDEGRWLLVSTPGQFLALVTTLLPFATVTLHYGWLAHLLAIVDHRYDEIEEPTEAMQRFLDERNKSRNVPQADRDAFETALRDLLVPMPSFARVSESGEALSRQATDLFQDVLDVFYRITTSAHADPPAPLTPDEILTSLISITRGLT